MDLTTKARVKIWANIQADDTAQDDALDQIITEVSAEAERIMKRHVETKARTEQYDLREGQSVVFLRGYGDENSAITTVKNDALRDFATADAIDSDLYYFSNAAGLLKFDTGLTEGPGVLQVVYTAGLGASVDEILENFPDIAMAVEMQSAHLWARRGELGLQSASFQGGSSSAPREHAHWIEQALTILRRRRRKRIGL